MTTKPTGMKLIDRIVCCPNCDQPLIIHLNVMMMSKEGYKMRKRLAESLEKAVAKELRL